MTDTLIIHPEIMQHNVLQENHTQNSFVKWLTFYLKEEVYGIQSKHTLEAKVLDCKGFIDWFQKYNGHTEISDWHPRDTQGYLSHLENLGRAASTINRVFASLRRFARWVHEQPHSPLLNGLPTKGIKEISVSEPDCKKLSQRDMHKLFKAADNLVSIESRKNARPRRDRAILSLLYYTGLRVSELTVLTLRQYKERYLHEVKRKGKTRSKAVYLPSACRAPLEDYIQNERVNDIDASNALFLSSRSKSFMDRVQVFRSLLKIADEANKHSKDNKIQIHPHRLRHTFGAELLEKTKNHTEVQQALGHTSLKYVGRYVRKTQEEREEMLEEIGRQLA